MLTPPLLLLASLAIAAPGADRVLVLDPAGALDDDERHAFGSALVQALLDARVRPAVLGQADLVALVDAEARRQSAGCDTDSCAAEIADAMGASLVVTSRVAAVGGARLLTVTLIDSKQARALARGEATADNTRALLSSVPGAVAPIADELDGGELPIAAVAWPAACVVAAVVVAGGGVAWDALAPSSKDHRLDVVDAIGPVAYASAIGLAAAAFFNPLRGE